LLPEFDHFGLFPWDQTLTRVGKGMAQVLASLPREVLRKNPANRQIRRPRESGDPGASD